MGSDFINFHAGCHGPVPLRGPFRGRTSRKRSGTIDRSQGRESTGFSVLPCPTVRTTWSWFIRRKPRRYRVRGVGLRPRHDGWHRV